jgi:polyisoprenoid-binding protein YceI
MAIAPGSHVLGPDSGSLGVRTYREGVAAKAGHDLIIEVSAWEATVTVGGEPADTTVELSADPRSLQIREGLRGVKPLTDKDRKDIRKTIDEKVLGGQPISFRSRAVREAGGRLAVDGDLTMAGTTRPVTAEVEVAADGRVSGTVPVAQTAWGIKPYKGFMGALKVRDEVEVVIDARLPAA